MIKNIDLGAVTAYALAVKHGYQGTEEEFSIILANSANYAKEAKEAKEASESSASEAETHKNNAEKILEDVNTAGAEQIRAIENAGAEQKEIAKREIAQKGAETLGSIPENYTALQGEVDELKGDINKLSEDIANKGGNVSASYDGNGTIVFGNSSNTQTTQYENGDEVSY